VDFIAKGDELGSRSNMTISLAFLAPVLVKALWRYLAIRDEPEKAFDATETDGYRSRRGD
jgi:hypothetical protein